MQPKRAEEILNSPSTIEVLYQHSPVWIEKIDLQNGIAQVKLLGPGNQIDVPIADLQERQ
ncbi:small, acid-soluble spore protein h 1 [Heliomicrobium modesticaldum Ice1]|uniref:Small, acid-soluble spore protein h 1 n=1 Tax=Heliobacterium modesticaldum (strain ATCC 51547 / Ice1) TaxID=498761 RepID=B0TID5_HELMI|nr:H-type small acid-soluble spore protein [Heliomicrobium modesticaldum]ABZ83555.1 small, acid-soluble spore protein h 1 [Heliomicrobium modesticaldum Ice1]